MTEQDYRRLSEPFRPVGRCTGLRMVNGGLSGVFYLSYPLLLAWLAAGWDERLLRCAAVPALSFVLVSAYRSWRSEKRPYEVLDIQPLIPKDTKGNSFPSRHVFSAFVIAMTALYLVPPLGTALLLGAAVLAVCRVIGGVHWPRDVVAGAAVGIAAGLLGYWLL